MVASAFQDLQVIKENYFSLVVRLCVCLFGSVILFVYIYVRVFVCVILWVCIFANVILCVCICTYDFMCVRELILCLSIYLQIWFYLCPLIWKYKLIFATIIPCDSYICNYDSMRIRIFATIRLCLCSFISKYDFVFVRIFANIYILFMFEYLLQWF